MPSSARIGAVQATKRSIASRAGYSSPRSRSTSLPSRPKRIARHMFSSIRRGAGSAKGTPSSTSRTACAMHATISAGERVGLLRARLRVADTHLHGAEAEMRPDRPPHLGELDDRACPHEELDVLAVRLPAAERVRHAATRKALGEALRPRRMKSRVAAVQIRRVRGDRQQQRQHRPQPVARRAPRGRCRARPRARAG